MRLFIGVDPGRGGGIAHINETGAVICISKMPATEQDLYRAIYLPVNVTGPASFTAVIEHVWSIPGQGGAFAFGKNVGSCLMALTAARIPFTEVLPRVWQKAMGIRYPKGATDTQKKNLTKRRAQQLFPTVDVTHATSDALLLADFCRRQEQRRHGEGEEAQQAEGTVTITLDRTNPLYAAATPRPRATGARRHGPSPQSSTR